MNFRNTSILVVAILSFYLSMTSRSMAYDGPVGVTFRAPFIEQKPDTEAFVLEQISIRAKVRIDNKWLLETDGKGRAFPDSFLATVADSEIIFTLRNRNKRRVLANILIPFDASGTSGTGFIEPLSISISLDNQLLDISWGPDHPRGMFSIRSYRVPLEIPAETTATLKIEASHPLAINPAWYQFICTDPYLRFSNFRNLARQGCDLEFEFESVDSRLQNQTLKMEWKEAFNNKSEVRQEQGAIKFKGRTIKSIRVFR